MVRICIFFFTKFMYNRYDIKMWYGSALRTFDVETTTSNRRGLVLRIVYVECEKKPLRASLDVIVRDVQMLFNFILGPRE